MKDDWSGSQDTAQGIVLEAVKPDGGAEQTARVFLNGVYDPDILDKALNDKDELKKFPLFKINIGNSSGSSGVIPHLYKKDRVLCQRVSYTDWVIIKLLSNHEPPGKADTTNKSTLGKQIPTTVEPTKQDNKNPNDKVKSKFFIETDLPNLATAYINRLVGTVFSKINNDLQKIQTIVNDLASLKRILDPELALLASLPSDIHEFFEEVTELPFGYIPPVITAGVNGLVDLTHDMMRHVDIKGGNIGSLRQFIKVDGWPMDLDDWEFKVLNTNIKNTDGSKWKPINGEFDIPSGLQAGIYHVEYVVYNKAKSYLYWLNPAHWIFGGKGSQFLPGVITFAVVPDMMKLDFKASISFFDGLEASIVGPLTGSDLIPQIKFELNPLTTDKSTFSQLYVVTGPGENTVKMELDFTVGPDEEDKNKQNKPKGSKKES